jgi:hypothetical protein
VCKLSPSWFAKTPPSRTQTHAHKLVQRAKTTFVVEPRNSELVNRKQNKYSQWQSAAVSAALRASGRIKALLFHEAGILRDVDVGAITSLPSYRGHAVYAKLDSAVAPTKDLFGWGGAVKLANADAEQLVKDYAVIEALCHSGLWTIE